VHQDPAQLEQLSDWLQSYNLASLFDSNGTLLPQLQDAMPPPALRMSANRHANGGRLRVPLVMPEFKQYGVKVEHPATGRVSPTAVLATFLRDIMRRNPGNFRLFSPDENASNKLQAVYEASEKTWMAERHPEDDDGGYLSPEGRVMEMLSEHTLEGWLEGYLLTGRHGLFNTYEAFAHIVDSMVSQHAKWLDKSRQEARWRAPVSSLNILLSSLVWRQDHNGFTHQDPGFLDVLSNKSGDVTRIYLPPDANCLLSVADHCLRSVNYVNVIVADKQPHLSYLTIDQAAAHCAKGVGIWPWASTDQGQEPDVVIASAGDIVTAEAVAAVALLRANVPDLKIRFVNVVDLYRLPPDIDHPHGMTHSDFDALFTRDKPVIFSFHGYPWLIHRFIYRRCNHANFHVRGYREKGNINTPLELAIMNQVDRYHLAIDVLNYVPRLQNQTAHFKESLKERLIDSVNYAHTEGVDRPEISGWTWPGA
jgi:xylulose-5-phosphate/fructose-6-phosphate phosphoketolase